MQIKYRVAFHLKKIRSKLLKGIYKYEYVYIHFIFFNFMKEMIKESYQKFSQRSVSVGALASRTDKSAVECFFKKAMKPSTVLSPSKSIGAFLLPFL